MLARRFTPCAGLSARFDHFARLFTQSPKQASFARFRRRMGGTTTTTLYGRLAAASIMLERSFDHARRSTA
jgi:hypothetical protein